jgi:hypothetical protein
MPACQALSCQSVRSSGNTADQAVNIVAKAARAAQNWSSQDMAHFRACPRSAFDGRRLPSLQCALFRRVK